MSAAPVIHSSKPFLKWPGGKRRVVPHLLPHLRLPARRLVEPFCGSFAVSLAVAGQVQEFWLNDINPDLVNLLQQLQESPGALMAAARSYFAPENNRDAVYYRLRDRFNASRDPLERAALFLYLNRHGYNGLCRYNAAGAFNVPFGRYKAPYFPERELQEAGTVLGRARVTGIDFTRVLDQCGEGDVVYCDPPYVPLSATADFTAYAAGGFGPADQERLAAAASRAAARGALVVISNHDTPETRALYQDADQYYIDVRRNISCNGDNRGLAPELIAVYAPR